MPVDVEKRRKRNREWNARNRAAMNAAHRRWREQPENAERLHEAHASWYAEHGAEYHTAWREANRERINESARRRTRPPEQVRRWNRYNHDRRRGCRPDALALDYIEVVLIGDPCAYCGGLMEHADHIVATISGGTGEWSNFTAACASCNTSKQATPLLHFLLRRG